MSNVRPWFRLASIARPTSQGSSDPPPPPPLPRQTPSRQVVVRQPAKQPSPPHQQQPPSPPRQQRPPSPPRQQRPPSPPRQQRPPSPPRQLPSPPRQQTPPPPPLYQEQSPYHSPPSRHMSPPTPPKAKSPSPPPPPPRSSYTPPPSPKEVQEAFPPRKPTSPPSPAHSTRSTKSEPESFRKAPSPRTLSPYSLPPPQLHYERETTQKNILTAEKTSQLQEPNHHNQSHNPNHNHQGNNTKWTHHQKPSSESDNIMRTRAITIAGENKGAVMEILRSPSSNKTGGAGPHPSRGFSGTGEKGRRLQSSSSSSSSDEGEGKKKATKNPNNSANNNNLPMKAFMNSNVQMINNSLVYNSMATHHDPGVHLKISRKPGSGNGFHVKDYGNDGGYTN
ncbi:putative extensin [Hirschfeldia incana]|nr:putative extensin [Hirschfeldia incana]